MSIDAKMGGGQDHKRGMDLFRLEKKFHRFWPIS
jgi:hypothetical protein